MTTDNSPEAGHRQAWAADEHSRDWFAPPPGQPDDITYSGPVPATRLPMVPTLNPPEDTRVWPPADTPVHDDGSTQPFPIVIEPRVREAPPQPQPEAPLEAPLEAQHEAQLGARPEEPPAPVMEPPVQAAWMDPLDPPQPRQGSRTRLRLLQAAGALVAVALGAGMPTLVGYHVYESGQRHDQFQTVQPGKAGAWQHVAWRVSVQRSTDPKCRSTTPDRTCLKIIVLRAALDQEGAIRHGQPEISTEDSAGRSWKALIDNDETPPDTTDHIVGHSYRMDVYSMVPTAVADTVEVLLRPSTYRSVPGQDFDAFLKDIEKNPETNDHVLRFLRAPSD